MSNDSLHKINKYKAKLQQTTDPDKRNIYLTKLKQYGVPSNGPINLKKQKYYDLLSNGPMNLLKPTEATLEDYKLNIREIRKNEPIMAFGYGATHELSGILPMIFERPPLGNKDILFKILFCGICHSDWHVLKNEWKNTKYPIITGHEMTGIVLEIGPEVTKFERGDKVAMSPLYNSCRQCTSCKDGEEQYCLNDPTETYNFRERLPTDKTKPTGPITQGGYSNIMIAHEYFLYKLPENLPLDKSAPLLCAGTTVYNALKFLNPEPGQILGIAGIGGLGHILIKIAKIFGLKVVALTTTEWKLKDSKRLGADEVILMKDRESLEKLENKLDFIIDTIPFKHDLDPYLKLLKVRGNLCIVGSFYSLNPDFNWIIRKGKIISGWNIGSVKQTTEFLDFCSEYNVLPDIEIITADKINDTRDKLLKSEAKYRYVIDIEGSLKT